MYDLQASSQLPTIILDIAPDNKNAIYIYIWTGTLKILPGQYVFKLYLVRHPSSQFAVPGLPTYHLPNYNSKRVHVHLF